MNFKIQPIEVFKINVYIILFLTIMNILGLVSTFYFDHDYVFGLVPIFDVNRELSIPTFYSSLALLVASLLLLIITINQKRFKKPYKAWMGLTIIFLLLSLDEISSIHEGLTLYVREVYLFSGLLYYSWIIPYSLAVLIFVLVYGKFLSQLPKHIMLLFIISGFLSVLGALGFEALGGWQHELNGYDGNLLYVTFYSIEEFLEMMGIAIFNFSLLTYISMVIDPITITFIQKKDI